MKEFADDNIKFDENGIKLSKQVENMWENEKLLVTSNFSFSQCFQKACFPGVSKGVIVWEWFNTPVIALIESSVLKQEGHDGPGSLS